MKGHALAGCRIGIFGKGGSGKSTLTVFLARALRHLGYPVVVLDADSTNLGLAAALGVDRAPSPLLDHFGGMVFSGGAVTCPVDDPTPLAGGEISLGELAPQYVGETVEGIRLLVAGKLGALGPGAGCDGPIVKIARDLRVMDQGPDLVTLVDFKAGFEDAARGAVTSVDWALAVVDPTTAAIEMAAHLTRLVARIRDGVPPATAHLQSAALVDVAVRLYREAKVRGALAVLSRMPDGKAEAYVRSALEKHAISPLGSFPEERSVQDLWLRGCPLHSPRLAEAALEITVLLEAVVAGSVPHVTAAAR